uniref:Plant bHLH transcription factor ACT-like domain-containing protein n=1 Tax=Aegilops tauschii subsp. strangulata TaxID=200361 RepID=A0A453I4Y7_AEGTS
FSFSHMLTQGREIWIETVGIHTYICRCRTTPTHMHKASKTLPAFISWLIDLVRTRMQVNVETLGHGSFLVNVLSDKSCPGLLVSILEAFDELGLSVLQATATCADTFRLEAIGGENLMENVDEHAVKQAVLRACSSHSGGGGNKQT